MFFTTVLSKQHRKVLKTNFEQLQIEQDAQRVAQETKADEVMAPDWETEHSSVDEGADECEGVGFKRAY